MKFREPGMKNWESLVFTWKPGLRYLLERKYMVINEEQNHLFYYWVARERRLSLKIRLRRSGQKGRRKSRSVLFWVTRGETVTALVLLSWKIEFHQMSVKQRSLYLPTVADLILFLILYPSLYSSLPYGFAVPLKVK